GHCRPAGCGARRRIGGRSGAYSRLCPARCSRQSVTSPHGPRHMLNRLTNTLDFQAQALTLRSERQRLIASNIANADTPGYVARDMDFAQALKEAAGATATP